jgi:hypothetical protein
MNLSQVCRCGKNQSICVINIGNVRAVGYCRTMQNIERQVRREAWAMTRREVLTKAIAKQLSWVQAET